MTRGGRRKVTDYMLAATTLKMDLFKWLKQMEETTQEED